MWIILGCKKRRLYISSWLSRCEYEICTYFIGSVALLSHITLKWSAILGLSFFAWYWWWPRESVIWGSSELSKELRTWSNWGISVIFCQAVGLQHRCCSDGSNCKISSWIGVTSLVLCFRPVEIQMNKQELKDRIIPRSIFFFLFAAPKTRLPIFIFHNHIDIHISL